MGIATRLTAPSAVASLVAGGLLAFSTPAGATGLLTCDPISSNQNYIACEIYNYASPNNARWTYNGVAQGSYYDDSTSFFIGCGAYGAPVSVSVTFTDDTNSAVSPSYTGTCGGSSV
jgi:hypothetical protein